MVINIIHWILYLRDTKSPLRHRAIDLHSGANSPQLGIWEDMLRGSAPEAQSPLSIPVSGSCRTEEQEPHPRKPQLFPLRIWHLQEGGEKHFPALGRECNGNGDFLFTRGAWSFGILSGFLEVTVIHKVIPALGQAFHIPTLIPPPVSLVSSHPTICLSDTHSLKFGYGSPGLMLVAWLTLCRELLKLGQARKVVRRGLRRPLRGPIFLSSRRERESAVI